MLFNSHPFVLCFLPITFLGFYLFARAGREFGLGWLVGASLFFYGWWDVRYVPLLLLSVAINYGFARLLIAEVGMRRRRALLVVGVSANLATLAYFKYAAFGAATLTVISGLDFTLAPIALPLGISFFTFTQIAYLVDASRGQVQQTKAAHYLLFVTYFPHLIAGPIIHHKEMMPQFARAGSGGINAENVAIGLTAFSLGLVKKVLLADNLAQFATPVFEAAAIGPVFLHEAWIGALAYTLQLYFDFSGYCDMALGLSLLFGIRLPLNFNSPYQAENIADFWRRWHMTLSRFLRDYVYIPLGGKRRGSLRRYSNLMATMLIGGLWHGAGWTFVAWGGLHGAYLVILRAWQKLPLARRLANRRSWMVASRALTFLAVVTAWVFFRASSFTAAGRMLSGMADLRQLSVIPEPLRNYLGGGAVLETLGFEFQLGHVPGILRGLLWIVPLLAVVWFLPNLQQMLGQDKLALASPATVRPCAVLLTWRPTTWRAVVVGALLALTVALMINPGEFLYYQF